MDNWISVNEDTPSDGVPVFAWDGKKMFLSVYCYVEHEGWFWGAVYSTPWENQKGWDCDCEIDDEYNVTHWIPFPEQPPSE